VAHKSAPSGDCGRGSGNGVRVCVAVSPWAQHSVYRACVNCTGCTVKPEKAAGWLLQSYHSVWCRCTGVRAGAGAAADSQTTGAARLYQLQGGKLEVLQGCVTQRSTWCFHSWLAGARSMKYGAAAAGNRLPTSCVRLTTYSAPIRGLCGRSLTVNYPSPCTSTPVAGQALLGLPPCPSPRWWLLPWSTY
jgi:hypothetical protein